MIHFAEEKEQPAVALGEKALSRGEELKHEKAQCSWGAKDVKRPFEEGEKIKLGVLVARL